MIKEFWAITGCTEDNIIPNFANLEQRVLHFATLESKKSVSTLSFSIQTIRKPQPW